MELLIIAAVVILLFGAGKVGRLGKDLGTSIKEFRRAIRDDEDSPAAAMQQHSVADAAPKASDGEGQETPVRPAQTAHIF